MIESRKRSFNEYASQQSQAIEERSTKEQKVDDIFSQKIKDIVESEAGLAEFMADLYQDESKVEEQVELVYTNDYTSMHQAVINNDIKLIKTLRASGVSADIKDVEGFLPFDYIKSVDAGMALGFTNEVSLIQLNILALREKMAGHAASYFLSGF